MLEINLARQLQVPSVVHAESHRRYEWVAVILSIGIGLASWWWTQVKQDEYDAVVQEKYVQAQSLAATQTSLNRLERYQEEKRRLGGSLEAMDAQEFNRKHPMSLLDGVSRSVEGLDIWLDRLHMVDQLVELHGQSFALEEIGKYIDALENHGVITSLPVVEILDQEGRDSAEFFSFMIRFVLEQQSTT